MCYFFRLAKKEAYHEVDEQKKEADNETAQQKKEADDETTEEIVEMPPSTVNSIEAALQPPTKVRGNESETPVKDEISIDEITKALIRTKLVDLAKDIIKDLPHTRGDLSARVGRTTNYTWFCGYLIGFVVDDAHQIITAVVLGAGNTKQANLFEPAIKEHIGRVGIPKGVAADSAFDDYQIHLFLDEKEIEGHVTSREHSKPKDGGYGTDQVIWVDHVPFCPNNSPLQSIGKAKKNGSQTFQGTECGSCDSYGRCYPSGEGKPKKFNLKPEEHRRWQENRQHNRTEEYKKAQSARFVSEGRFGLAKNNHKGNRAPYRSDVFNMIAALMMAIVMNVRILAKHK